MTPDPQPHPDGPPAPTSRRPGARRLVAVAGWLCLAAAVAAWALVRAGDSWEPATAATFAPLHFLPIVPAALLVIAVLVHRRALLPLVPALVVTAVPVSGFCVPRERARAAPAGPPLRVLTCNMHYARLPSGPLDRLLAETGPDVVALQEWRDGNTSPALEEPGWHVRRVPGLFLASRYPVLRAERLGAHSADDRGSIGRYELDAPGGTVTLFSAHFASPRDGLGGAARGDADGLAANSRRRWAQSRALAADAARASGRVLLVGDFNTPPQSAIFRDVWRGYADAFGTAGWGWGHTFRTRWAAVRIDYILIGGGGRALRCWVGSDVGSPHLPVVADVVWP